MCIKLLFLDVGSSHATSHVDGYSQDSRHCYLRSRSPMSNGRGLTTGQSLGRTVDSMRRKVCKEAKNCDGIANPSCFQVPRVIFIIIRQNEFPLDTNHLFSTTAARGMLFLYRVMNFLSLFAAQRKTPFGLH